MRIKFKNFSGKIEAKIGNFKLVQSDFTMHQQCLHEIIELKDFLTKPESRSDRKDMIEIIGKCRKSANCCWQMLIDNPSAPSHSYEWCYMCCNDITIVEKEINISINIYLE